MVQIFFLIISASSFLIILPSTQLYLPLLLNLEHTVVWQIHSFVFLISSQNYPINSMPLEKLYNEMPFLSSFLRQVETYHTRERTEQRSDLGIFAHCATVMYHFFLHIYCYSSDCLSIFTSVLLLVFSSCIPANPQMGQELFNVLPQNPVIFQE